MSRFNGGCVSWCECVSRGLTGYFRVVLFRFTGATGVDFSRSLVGLFCLSLSFEGD